MDEEEHAAETKLTMSMSFNDGDEFVENAKSASSPSASASDKCDKKWLWLHAAFHCIVAMVVSATYNA